jgi:hypothetical protein
MDSLQFNLTRHWRHRVLRIGLTLVFVALGCRTTLATNRQQVLFIPEDQEIQMGLSAYEETLGEHPPSQN